MVDLNLRSWHERKMSNVSSTVYLVRIQLGNAQIKKTVLNGERITIFKTESPSKRTRGPLLSRNKGVVYGVNPSRHAYTTTSPTTPPTICVFLVTVFAYADILRPGGNGELVGPKISLRGLECILWSKYRLEE